MWQTFYLWGQVMWRKSLRTAVTQRKPSNCFVFAAGRILSSHLLSSVNFSGRLKENIHSYVSIIWFVIPLFYIFIFLNSFFLSIIDFTIILVLGVQHSDLIFLYITHYERITTVAALNKFFTMSYLFLGCIFLYLWTPALFGSAFADLTDWGLLADSQVDTLFCSLPSF